MTTHILPRPRLAAGLAALALGLAAAASAQTSTSDSSGSSTLAHRDRSFMEKAAENSSQELALSQLAADHSQNSDVKEFAAKMVSDHTALNSKLMALASQKGVSLDKYVTKGQQDDYDSLSKENGPDFDKDYLKHMVKGHTDTVELFKSEGAKSHDSDLAGFANDNVMTIQHHLDMAQSLEQKLNP
jgi:putative membrane protein